MTTNKLKKLFGANLRKAATGTGYAIIDTWRYQGCTVMGEYPCFPLKAWAECMGSAADVERIGEWEAVSRATERAHQRINGKHFGADVWGATGTYTVR